MVANKKYGRSIDELMREDIQLWATLGRKMIQLKALEMCINPEVHDEEDRIHVSKEQVFELMVSTLEQLARSGKLQPPTDMGKFAIREEYRKLQAAGIIRARAIPLLMEKYSVSESVVVRAIKVNKEKVKEQELRAQNAKADWIATQVDRVS